MTDYKFEAGKTYPLRGGLTARITVTDIKGAGRRPIGGYINRGDCEEYQSWYPNGCVYSGTESDLDIVMPETERKSVWMNWYGTDNGTYIYRTRNDAELEALSGHTHVLEIIIENGKTVDVKIHKVER